MIETRDYRATCEQEIEQQCDASLPTAVDLIGAFVRATKPKTSA